MALSRDSLAFYDSIAKEIQFRAQGYLFLYPRSKWQVALSKQRVYEQKKIPVDYLEPQDLKNHLPEFKNLKGVAGATYTPGDGLLDPHLLKEYYRAQAREKGVKFLDHHYFTGAEIQNHQVRTVTTKHWSERVLPEPVLHQLITQQKLTGAAWQTQTFRPQVLINCTGAWLRRSTEAYRKPAPIRPIRRQICLFETHDEDLSDRGMIVDASGLYFHHEGREGGQVLAGYSNRDEPPGFHFHYDGEKFFVGRVWLRLYRRGGREHFAALKHLRGWAGLYAVGPDQNAILGKAPGLENCYELGGATGRGVMQSFALGRAVAELVLQGHFEKIDLVPLSPKRFAAGKAVPERLDI
jgi:glycine/D-amino acid oxidase-like deaminating enzyme